MRSSLKIIVWYEDLILWYYVLSLFIYVCECIGLRNIVIMMYVYYALSNKWFDYPPYIFGGNVKMKVE